MRFSYNLIKKFVDINTEPKKIAELLNLKSAEVDSIEKVGNDQAWEIKILYNRGDMLAHRNIAREISALTGANLNLKKPKVEESQNAKAGDMLKVEIKDAKLCPRYTGRIIRNIKVGKSPKWIQDILKTAGIRPINNIVDITNYVMLEYGQPMHAFDYEKLDGGAIIVRTAKKREKISLLDEMRPEYELDSDILVIADRKKPVAIAGIKGGRDAGISDATHTIVLESANFNGSLIRRTASKLNIRTDASNRFQYGLDPNQASEAIDRAAQLIQETAKGEVLKGVIDAYPKKVLPWTVNVKESYVNSLLGTEIRAKDMINILNILGFKTASKKGSISVVVPTYRRDIASPEDVIEEIGRVYGYNEIKPVPPIIYAYSDLTPQDNDVWEQYEYMQSRRLIKNILKGLGFTETYNYSFISNSIKEAFGIGDAPELINPVSAHYRFMRPGLLPNLIACAINNLRFSKSLNIFEIGKKFLQKDGAITEHKELAGVIVRKNALMDAKGSVESLLNQLGIIGAEFDSAVDEQCNGRDWYHPKNFASIKYSGKIIGAIGETSPFILKRLGAERGIEMAQFSFDMEKLFKALETNAEYEPIPKYPSVIRDTSIIIDKDIKISEVLNVINAADNSGLVKDVDVFDIYYPSAKKNNNKKSLAFHTVYRSDERTLNDKEVDAIEKNIHKALTQSLGAEIK